MPETVTIVDVTLRDGLQDQATVVETGEKVQVAEMLAAAGFRAMEVTSFVHPAWVPQLADAEALLARFGKDEGVERHALVPNRRGLDRALQTDVECVAFVVSASTLHNQHNLNRSTAESLAQIRDMTREALEAGRLVRAGISTAFGCPYQGEVTKEEVLRVLEAYLEAGVQHVNLADTIGVATPESFERILGAALAFAGGPERLGIHLHDPGSGVANLVGIALDAGIRSFDAAIGGLGGCPFAPGAPGNCRVENLVPQVEARGFETGITTEALPRIALTLGLALGRGVEAPQRATEQAAG
jgi:hydroxymethylglutaryl-CoA lyase